MTGDYDVIVVFGGTNDYANPNPTPLGNIAFTTNLSQVGQCTVYVSATKENAGSVYVYHNEVVGETTITGSPNNALLKDEFVYMSTSETESGWYFDENGDIQIRTVE